MPSEINKRDMDQLLYEVAKEYKKMHRNVSVRAEIILVGGASILANYGFRATTTDIDASIQADSTLKDAINLVGDRHDLEKGWLNSDFSKTESYSPELIIKSKPYKTFYGCLDVRTIADEYLIAMKMRAARIYKHDLSDIVGIVMEMKEQNKELDTGKIGEAYRTLYNAKPDSEIIEYVSQVLLCEQIEDLYYETQAQEKNNREALFAAEKEYPGEINANNVNSFIRHFSSVRED